MLQLELHEGQVVKNTSEYNGMQKGSVRFTSEEVEQSPTNANAWNLVTRSCTLFGDSKALLLRLQALGIIDKAQNVNQEALDKFCIVKIRSYIPRDKNHEPAFCPYPDHPQFGKLMVDQSGSNYFHSFELKPKFIKVDDELVPQDTFVDLTKNQEPISLDITDYPRLVELASELTSQKSDQEA